MKTNTSETTANPSKDIDNTRANELFERAKKEQLDSSKFPTDSYVIEYQVDGETFFDLSRGTQVTLFDMYYDKFKRELKSINYGKGNIKPALWNYQKPKEKKKRR